MKEIVVKIKGTERRYRRDFLDYQQFEADLDDPVIKQCIEESLKEFKEEPDSIEVQIKLKAQ